MKVPDKRQRHLTEMLEEEIYWKIYMCLEVSGGKQSAEGANFIFPAIYHLERHLPWAQRHITNLLPISLEKHQDNFIFQKSKGIKAVLLSEHQCKNVFYMNDSVLSMY